MSENKSNIFLSWRWKLAALKCFNLFEIRYYVKYELILLRAKYSQNSSSGFYFPPNLRILGAIFDKKQNNGLHQLIFKPMFRKVKRSDFSEIFTRGDYMLKDSFKTRMPFSQVLWT